MKLLSKVDFKSKTLFRDKGHYVMIKGSIQQDNATIVNIYAPNIRALKYIKQILINLKGEIDSSIIIVDLNNYIQ